MPESIEARHAKRKREAVRNVAAFTLLQIACAGGFAALRRVPELPDWAAALLAVLGVLCIVPIPGAFVVLRQRFHEIEGGEQDAAGQY